MVRDLAVTAAAAAVRVRFLGKVNVAVGREMHRRLIPSSGAGTLVTFCSWFFLTKEASAAAAFIYEQ